MEQATLPRASALATWQAHRDRFGETSLWPLIVPEENRGAIAEGFARRGSVVTAEVNAAAFLDGRLAEWTEDGVTLNFDPTAMDTRKPPRLGWQIGAFRDNVKLSLALVPCRAPWQVLETLGFGGWNDCPAPAEHTAVLRGWHERNGAVPLVLGGDALELLAAPIEAPEEAKRVATEHYAYAPDTWTMDEEYVRVLTAWLRTYSVWTFWWD